MGLRLLQEQVAELFIDDPETGETSTPTEFGESNQAAKTFCCGVVDAERKKQAREAIELSHQLVGGADSAVDVLNDLVS